MVLALGIHILFREIGHPRTGTLGGAGEEVGVEHADETSVGAGYVIGLYIGMVDLNLGVVCELQAIELCGKAEYTVNHVVELEVGAEGLFVKRVFVGLELVGIIRIVPRHNLDGCALEG